ncbi:MAG: protein translocase subunit SecD [Atopobiaceae bacterium]|nr:protein translocase subunit SecD [Atopobiaceae bacterium]
MARDNNSSPKTGVDRWNATEKSSSRTSRQPKSKGGSRPRNPQLRRYQFTLLALVVLLVVCAVGFMPPAERITQGLDIRGGVSVILSATKTDGSAPSADEMATATAIVQNRVNALGAAETSVQQQGTNSILVQIPGATDADAAVKTIGQTGHLEFVRLDAIGDADALAKISAGTQDVKLKEGTYTAFMDGSSIKNSAVAQASNSATGAYAVNVSLDSDGAKKFAEVTSELAPTHGQIAIVLDGVVNSAPAVQSVISDGNVSITGNFTLDEAKGLKTVLDSGSLPVTLSYSESRVVGPTLGQDSLRQGIFAIGIGAVIVIAYLFFFYQGLGLLTMGSLAVFGIIYLGLLALLSRMGAFALTLPGLAGVVLTTGSAADSSILVLERFREEVRMGRSVRNAAIGGTKEGISTSLDADAVQLVTALALFFMAVGPVKGFGLTTALGILCDLVTMFLFKAPALRLLGSGTIQAHPKFWGIASDLAEAEELKQEMAAADAASKKGGVAHA